jgi:hypothetical protein
MKSIRQWSLLHVASLCAGWVLFTFAIFRWLIAPWSMRHAQEMLDEYVRTHTEVSGGIGAVSFGLAEPFLLVALVPPACLVAFGLVRRHKRPER